MSGFFLKVTPICLVVLLGCSDSGDRQAIEGTISLDGQPLAEGQITFIPEPGTKGPTAGGKIERGNYFVPSAKGTFDGKFRVEITAPRATGRKVKASWGEMVDEVSNYIPARYNLKSELTAEVQASEPNRFDFTLRSK